MPGSGRKYGLCHRWRSGPDSYCHAWHRAIMLRAMQHARLSAGLCDYVCRYFVVYERYREGDKTAGGPGREGNHEL